MSDKATTDKSDSDVSAPISLPDDSSPRKKNHSRRRRRRSPYVYYTDSELSEDDLPLLEDVSLLERPLTSGVRYYSYDGYQNRMRTDGGDFGIEVFVAKPDWYNEMIAEEDKRDCPPPLLPRQTSRYAYISRLQLSSGSETAPEGRIMRIRLRSQVVIRALASVAGYDGIAREKVVEFHRPFRVLEESLSGMKSKFSEMERAMEKTLPEISEGKVDEEDTTSPTTVDQDLEHMRCFVHFVEQVVLPIREQFQGSELQKRQRVCFEDIPYLFQPGSLAFLTHRERTKRLLHRSAVQRVWRMASCHPATVPTVYRNSSTSNPSQFTRWSLYSFDYDGEHLVPIWATVSFERFTGEMDITSLECYPLSLHENVKDIIEEQNAWGKLFLNCIRSSTKHHYYSGWTFITGLFAETLLDDEGQEVHFPEHIESEIVVDFKETLQSYPGWETFASSPQSWSGLSWDSEPYAEYPLKVWDKDINTFPQPRLSYPVNTSIIVDEQELYESEAKAWFAQDSFLDKKANWREWIWSDEDIVLLPRRVFAYILRERKFTRIDVRSIEFNTNQGNLTLDQIQMKPERRRMIRSAVAAHFRGKQGPSASNLDPVRGKGKGLVILLHGAPGVGKTATAEAVAAETERPLFPITCGDLGFSPAAVERSLKDIFRYAHLWNCILLFDEADVFLTQRERGGGNLERNALVGVFLRVLEYYSGILFLTTNRVGALDEGFRSRVHLSLCYPNLSLEDTTKILEANLQRLPRVERAEDGVPRDGYLKVNDKAIIDFVSAEYEEYSKKRRKKRGPWNGHQIRNAVQIAAGLALYDKQVEMQGKGEDDIPAFLTAEHFRAVAVTTSEFEDYLNTVKIGDEEDQAKRRQERADHWRARERNEEDHSDRDTRRRKQMARYRDSSVDPDFSSSRAQLNPRSHRSDVFDRTQPANRRRQDDMGGGRGVVREQQRPRGSRMTRRAQDDYHEDDDDLEDESLRDPYDDDEEEQEEYTYERRSQGGRAGAGRPRLRQDLP
ncbi:AAA family [Colletotrichum kahawae]|uniref:AAA family n=1 Tax=Colletotrichum kahawae TaxID=34407 RepID=A0AAE0D2U0_COLKA|nr:AAA family [Colletotrichum kahawae]